MRQILITGRATGAGTDRRGLYAQLVELCRPYAERIYSPLDTMEFRGSDQERYARALSLVSTSDVVIAEMSLPSTGQGIEIQEAARLGVPVIVVAEKGSKVSGLVLGTPSFKEAIYYGGLDELHRALGGTLRSLRDGGMG